MPGSVAKAWSAVVASAGEKEDDVATLVQCLGDAESNAREGHRNASTVLIGSVGDGRGSIADVQLLCKLILKLARVLDDENVYSGVAPLVRFLVVVTTGAIATVGAASGVFSELATVLPEFPIGLQCEVFRAFEQLQSQLEAVALQGGEGENAVRVCAFQAQLEIWSDAASQGSLGFAILLSRFVERLATTTSSGSDAKMAAVLLEYVALYIQCV